MFNARCLMLMVAPLLLLTASGCSASYCFDLTVTVVGAADGKPLPDAQVSLDFGHDKIGESPPQTDASGRYVQQFSVSIIQFDGNRIAEPWNLTVERGGFTPQVVNIKPTTKPAKYGIAGATPLNITVRLEPAKAP